MRDPVRPFPLFQTSGQRHSRYSLCDDGGFITQINHFITAGNSAEAVGCHEALDFADTLLNGYQENGYQE